MIQYLPLTLADKSFELTDDVVPENAPATALPVEETEKKGHDSTVESAPTQEDNVQAQHFDVNGQASGPSANAVDTTTNEKPTHKASGSFSELSHAD